MIYCESPTLEKWIAPPQEDLPRPTWTKLIANGFLISNSLEYADWGSRPVQPIVCETCWFAGCTQAGLADVIRLDDQLLWLRPRLRRNSHLNQINFIREPVLMPVTTWEQLRTTASNLPTATTFPRATYGDLVSLWLHEIPDDARIQEIEAIVPWLRTALASDPIDVAPATHAVSSLIDWIGTASESIAEGRIMNAASCGNPVNTFYFDGYEWPSFLVGREHCLAIGAEWLYVE